MAMLPNPPKGTPPNVVLLWNGKTWVFADVSHFKGATGPAGPVGPMGATGHTGSTGAAGPTAIVFYTGSTWPVRTATTPVIWVSIGYPAAPVPTSIDGDIWLMTDSTGKSAVG